MAKQYDATLNAMIDGYPTDWGYFLASRASVPLGPITTLDTDLSSTLQADRLFQIDGAIRAVLHLELESTGRLGIPGELLRYNVAAWGATGLPVHSIVMLLRPKANASDLTGHYEIRGADQKSYLSFRYTVIRVWEESFDSLLAGGPGLAPLALLTDEANSNLAGSFERFRTKLKTDQIPDNVERTVLGLTYVLCGLRYTDEQIENLYGSLSMTLEDSVTYQKILHRGRVDEAQSLIIRMGTKQFGEATNLTTSSIRGITDHERLERIAVRILDATNWDDLLATP